MPWDVKPSWLLLFLWFISFMWLNQTNQINQMNQTDHKRRGPERLVVTGLSLTV
jgi:hypothetical protein